MKDGYKSPDAFGPELKRLATHRFLSVLLDTVIPALIGVLTGVIFIVLFCLIAHIDAFGDTRVDAVVRQTEFDKAQTNIVLSIQSKAPFKKIVNIEGCVYRYIAGKETFYDSGNGVIFVLEDGAIKSVFTTDDEEPLDFIKDGLEKTLIVEYGDTSLSYQYEDALVAYQNDIKDAVKKTVANNALNGYVYDVSQQADILRAIGALVELHGGTVTNSAVAH